MEFNTQGDPVTIEDNVWLGMNVIVLKGVTIGKNSMIAANSVVTKDIPENVLAGGYPCKVIRSL
jgi:acetyltransferase-like isoleucine patch superfamily enzyme